MGKLRESILRRELLLAALLLSVGALLRLLCLDRFPPGLNQDEASIGADAWSLLNYGTDRNGAEWPVLLKSWGSGQNALYAYLSFPFLYLLGRSVAALRLCAAFWGSASLLFFWRMARRTLGPLFGLAALALLALNPWHLLLSRWALESNLLPAFLLLGTCLLCRVDREPRLLCASAAVFAVSLYAYGTAFLFLPLYLLGALLRLLRRRAVTPGPVLLSFAVFALIAFPLAYCQLRNALGLPETRLLGLTLPALTSTRQAATVSLSLSHWRDLARLLWKQSDGLLWNYAGPFGLFYGLPGLFLVLLGLAAAIGRLVRGQAGDGEFYALLALLSGLAAALFIDVNVNRVNFLFLPLVWCQAMGLRFLLRLLPALVFPALASLLAAAALLGAYYVTDYAEALGPGFHRGLPEAVACAESLEPETVWITGEVNMPYVYALFVTGADPAEYLATVEYRNPGAAFEQVGAFGHFRFYGEPPAGLCILPKGAAEGEVLAVFGGYAVVLRGES